ncbi:MAG: site-specific integrase [Candidatus Brocadia sp.]|nr:site-specific integrase [Candidatus Brocadia sp.]
MNFLDTDSGRKLFNQYLKKVNGSSQRVYRSEIQQFFDFIVETHCNASLQGITKDVLHAYQEKLSKEHTRKTAIRKFSILNGFLSTWRHQERSGTLLTP